MPKQKEADIRVCPTYRAMSITSYKTEEEYTPAFIDESARELMESGCSRLNLKVLITQTASRHTTLLC